MPIVFICSGVLNLLLLFDKFNLKNKYKKTLYIIFLFLIQISYFSFYVSVNDIYFNFFQCILFLFLLVFSFFKSKIDFKILICSFITAFGYDFMLNNFFDNPMIYSYSNFYFLFVLILPLFVSDFYKSQSLLFLNLFCLIISNINYEISKFTFAIIDFDFCLQIVLMFLIFKFLNYLIGLYFVNLSNSRFNMRSYKNEKNCFVLVDNFFYLFNIN